MRRTKMQILKGLIIKEYSMSKLTTEHCKEILNQRLLIGSDKASDGKRKRFYFHVWLNEYIVEHGSHGDEKIIDSGQAVEELLEVYNEL